MELLEREGALAEFVAARDAASLGAGRVVLVTGEPGIGKTSLVAGFAAGLGPDARVLWGTCDDLSIPRPLGPIRDLAGSVSRELEQALARDDRPQEVHTLLLAELSKPPSPTVLVIEDVHWADEATLDAITVVGRRVASLPAVLVLTFRGGEVGPAHPLHATLEGLGSGAVFLELAPLSREAVASLAGDTADEVFALTGGNPFYVTELLAARPTELPPSVANAVLGRAARLEDTARRLVEVVSVVPHRIDTSLLDAAMPDWARAAEEPERRQLLQVDARYVRFRHELARAAIRSGVPVARRRRLHGEILKALLAAGADPADIVHHAEEAGDTEVVAEYAVVAARRAAALESNREACSHFRRAADFADRLPVDQHASLLEQYAMAAYTVGRLDEAFPAIRRAIALYEEVGDVTAVGRCTRILSRLHWYAGEGDAARRHARTAIEILEPLGESAELARAYSGLSQLAMLSSHVEETVRWGEQAVGLAERLDERSIQAHALINVGIIRHNLDPDDTSTIFEAYEVADAAADRHEAVRALIGVAYDQMSWVRPSEAAAHVARGIAYAREHQVDTLLAYLNALSAWLDLRAGRWETAELMAQGEVDKGGTVAQLLANTVLTELAVRRGDEDAEHRLADLREQADRTGELQRIGPVLELEVEWALTRGTEWPRARFDRVMEIVGPAPCRVGWGGARLAAWAAVAGLSLDFDGLMPAPHAAMLRHDWAGAAGAFGEAGWTYDRALMLSLLDDEQSLRDAVEIARSLGGWPLVDRVQRRMRELRIPVPRGPRDSTRANPAGLTTRQLQVLRLVSEGLTNAEIADRLVVSTRTAEHHVAATLLKLGTATRREAARRAAELGLLTDS